jgi:ubiquinone/menaquinone biosynthesis C-methylase UbiE
MMPPLADQAQALKAQEHALWEQAAPGYDEIMAPRTDLFTKRLVEQVGAGPGDRALDVACGPGQAALLLGQTVSPGGVVVGLDLAASMVRIATAHAAARALRCCVFLEGDAERLPFAEGAFDVVTCLFGLMLLPRPALAAAEIRRVLRPGGRAGFVVWATAEEVPIFKITSEALKRAVPDLAPPAGPGPCSLGAPGALEAALSAGGFVAPSVQRERRTWVFSSVDALWADMSRSSRTLMQTLGGRDASARARIEDAFRESAQPYVQPGGAVAMDVVALLAVAQA